jgi:dTDP-glucose 4,6-dehydratase
LSKTLLVTGGAGFIGSEFVRAWARNHPEDRLVVLDALTYAGNRANLTEVERLSNYRFCHGRIQDAALVEGIFLEERPSYLVNFAAETHVDRSVLSPTAFIETNVLGTGILLEAARSHGIERFLHVSTDEVYGEIETGSFHETHPLEPRSPYAAAKAGSDLLVLAHANSYKTPAIITRGSNTFGPYQYPEKLAPFFLTRGIQGKKMPLYGAGLQVRDWIHVSDHAAGISHALEHGVPGEVYNVGGGNERPNVEVAELLIKLLGVPQDMLKRIPDPRGAAHDKRYSLDTTKLGALGWSPKQPFEQAMADTVTWYRENESWWRPIIEDEGYQAYVRQYYGKLLGDDL